MMEAHAPQPLKYDDNLESWKTWKEEFESYLKASEKYDENNDVKIAILLNCIGDEGLDIFYFFKESQKDDFENIMQSYEKYFLNNENELMQSFYFHNMYQGQNESIDDFYEQLKKHADLCNFECPDGYCKNTFKERMIRDQLIFGIYDTRVQQRLMRLKHLSTEKILEYCKSIEWSRRGLEELDDDETETLGVKEEIEVWDDSVHDVKPFDIDG